MSRAEFLRRFDTAPPYVGRRGSLTDEQVRWVRKAHAAGVPRAMIGGLVGLKPTTVSHITAGRMYGGVA